MWRLQLLGPCRLECDAVSAAPSAKQQALLGLLGSAGPAGLTREHLIALLWEEAPRARARQSLRQLLSDLRRECAVVQVSGSEHVMLDQLCVSVDLWQFERAARSEDPEQLQQASSLYAGPLLQEIAVVGEDFEAWLTSERTRIERLARSALERLARAHAGSSATGGCGALPAALAGTGPLQRTGASPLDAVVGGLGPAQRGTGAVRPLRRNPATRIRHRATGRNQRLASGLAGEASRAGLRQRAHGARRRAGPGCAAPGRAAAGAGAGGLGRRDCRGPLAQCWRDSRSWRLRHRLRSGPCRRVHRAIWCAWPTC